MTRLSATVLAAYALLSFLFFGVPLALHPGRSYVGGGADPQIFIWSFAWWPHAIGHGLNPFVTHAIWAPDGFNLAWATTTPALALAFAPLTILAGPVVSYNVAALLMPALAGWAAYLLCRYVTGNGWASFAGGYLFGFSSYMLGQLEGHLHVSAIFCVPLVALVLLRYLDGGLEARGLLWRLTGLLALELAISTELFFTLTLALAVALAIAFLVAPARRTRLKSALGPVAAAYVLAALLLTPLLYFAISDFHSESVNPPDFYSGDLLNLIVPTQLVQGSGTWATHVAGHFGGNDSERGAYLGVPMLLIVCLYARRRLRTPGGRFLVVSLVVSLVALLGPALHVYGKRIVVLPWAALHRLPLFDNVLTARLSMYAALAATVVVASWAASSLAPLWLRITLTALAVVAIVPHVRLLPWTGRPVNPTFFATDGAYRRCLARGENVIVLPYGSRGSAMLWQARTGFWFRMAGGYLSPVVPRGFERYAATRALNANETPEDGGAAVLRLARAKGVGAILVEPGDGRKWVSLLDRVTRGRTVGGMVVYPLRRGAALPSGCRPT